MTQNRYVVRHGYYDTMAQIVVFVFSVTLTLIFDLCYIFVAHTAHDVLEYPCEVS